MLFKEEKDFLVTVSVVSLEIRRGIRLEKRKYLIETFKLTNESCDFGIQRKSASYRVGK